MSQQPYQALPMFAAWLEERRTKGEAGSDVALSIALDELNTALTNCDAKASGNPDFEDGFNPFMDGYDVDPDGPQNQLLPFRDKDIQRGLILLRTSNNAHGFTNCDILTDRIEKLPAKGRQELARMMRNIATEIDDEPKATGWRDIESAPKDWSNILLYPAPEGFNDEVVVGYYALHGEGDEDWHTSQDGAGEWDVDPTHWRPLPPPPGEEGETELVTRLRMEAERWAQEARAHKSSLHECYQAVTGATGEPGNWHGANPIREYVAAHEALRAENAELKARYDKLEAAASLVCDDAVPDGAHPESFCEVGTPELEDLRSALSTKGDEDA